MNSHRPARLPARAPTDRIGHATTRRTPLLVVAGAVVGIFTVGLLEPAGPILVVLVLIGAAAVATFVAVRGRRLPASNAAPALLREWRHSSQFGADREQSIARQTGARI